MGNCARGASSSAVPMPTDQQTLLDLLGSSWQDCQLPSLLLSGKAPRKPQESFAEKPVERRGNRTLESLGRAVGLTCQRGRKRASPSLPNQDNFLVALAGHTRVYGVFDGHGPHGQAVSSFVAPAILKQLARQPVQKDPGKALECAFLEVQADCAHQRRKNKLDCSLSGTTATLLLEQPRAESSTGSCARLTVAHCGDSRAVLACDAGASGLQALELTTDHKPCLEEERGRILAAGGSIRAQNGDPNERVFVQNSTQPGLALSRSLGDLVAAAVGVTSQPDIGVWEPQRNWRFVLLCSDGVWEFITSQEAVELVGAFAPEAAQEAAHELAAEARRRWLREEDGDCDDITALCIWLQ